MIWIGHEPSQAWSSVLYMYISFIRYSSNRYLISDNINSKKSWATNSQENISLATISKFRGTQDKAVVSTNFQSSKSTYFFSYPRMKIECWSEQFSLFSNAFFLSSIFHSLCTRLRADEVFKLLFWCKFGILPSFVYGLTRFKGLQLIKNGFDFVPEHEVASSLA